MTTSFLHGVEVDEIPSASQPVATGGGLAANPVVSAAHTLQMSSVYGRVPAGRAMWPWDASGNPFRNDGTDYAGAFTRGCI